MSPVYPVRLEGDRVVLREFTTDDLQAVTEIVGSEKVTYWLSFDPRSPDEAAQMLTGIIERAQQQPRTEYYLAVTADGSDTAVGLCRLALGGVRAAKLGFAIHHDHWGRGLATDAVATMVAFGFDTLDLHRITGATGPENEASIAVMTKLGFAYEGRLRDHVHTNGTWRDSLLYSLLEP